MSLPSENSFVGYEYTHVSVDASQRSFLLDCYRSFGWEIDETAQRADPQAGVLYFKRSRKLLNRTELTRLQRNFEACTAEINHLEHRPKRTARIRCLAVALLGTAFMAASVFAVTANPPIIWLCVLFAIPGFIGWIAPCFIYPRVLKAQTEKAALLIEAKKEEIDQLCEKGYRLL